MKNKNHKLIVSVKAKNKNKLLLKIFELYNQLLWQKKKNS